MTTKRQHYTPATKYTRKDLDRAVLSDLEMDLRCAQRDGLMGYAWEVELQFIQARTDFQITYGEEYVSLPYVELVR